MKVMRYAAAFLFGALAVSAMGTSGWAQINPFRTTKLPGMAKEDQQRMLDATQRLNQREHPVVGGTESWNSPTSSGTIRLDRIFQSHGMTCHTLRYEFTARQGAPQRNYRANWCKTPSGEWKTTG